MSFYDKFEDVEAVNGVWYKCEAVEINDGGSFYFVAFILRTHCWKTRNQTRTASGRRKRGPSAEQQVIF